MKRIWWIVSALAALAAAPVYGQLRGQLGDAAGIAARQQLELAGIRVGMAWGEVAPVLVAAGYRPSQSGEGPSWDAAVARVASQRPGRLTANGRVLAWQSFVKDAERVEVHYRPTPAGAVVSEVAYTINADAIANQRLRAVLLARYGRAGWENGGEFLYCTRGEPVCNQLAYVQGLQMPSVYVEIGAMQHSIRLRSGARILAAHDAALRAEVDRRAPRMRSPTF